MMAGVYEGENVPSVEFRLSDPEAAAPMDSNAVRPGQVLGDALEPGVDPRHVQRS